MYFCYIHTKTIYINLVEWTVWEQLIALYPSLVDCTTSTSTQVCCSLREALHEYADLLEPPKNVLNGSS